jgi:sugar lactone lactonase YvrE
MCSAVAVDTRGLVYLFHRGKQPIVCFSATGKFVRAWGDDLIAKPHGLRIDRDENIWATDTGHHLVLKFNPSGKLLLALGKADSPGTGTDQFDRPTDVAFGPEGEIYVADGYGNSRVMQFDAKGKFVSQWGKRGEGHGEFNVPHAILVDAKGRVLVGDRENHRIQVFDGAGKLLEIWEGLTPYGLAQDKLGTIFVADNPAKKVLRLESGRIVQSWGDLDSPHMLTSDGFGNLYVTDSDRLLKLVRER